MLRTCFLVAAATMWTGQMKSQFCNQVAMQRAQRPAELEPVGRAIDSSLLQNCVLYMLMYRWEALSSEKAFEASPPLWPSSSTETTPLSPS